MLKPCAEGKVIASEVAELLPSWLSLLFLQVPTMWAVDLVLAGCILSVGPLFTCRFVRGVEFFRIGVEFFR